MDMWLWVVTIAAADGGFDEDGTGGVIGPFGTREIAEKFAAALAKHRGYPDDEVKVEARLTTTEGLRIGIDMELVLVPFRTDDAGNKVMTFAFRPVGDASHGA